MKQIYKTLLKEAEKVRLKAYVPYSKFKVGAAVLSREGKIFSGCNIENASFGLTICAERVALFKAVSEGYNRFMAMAIICDSADPCFPCGACRQIINEFGNDITIICSNLEGKTVTKKISELLPDAFTRNSLR